MRALVTGVTGFAGLHLTEHLVAQGDEVLGVSRQAMWPAWKREDCPAVELWQWDMAADARSDLQDRLSDFRPDVVYHLAALAVPSDCGEHEPNEHCLAVNVTGTRRLVDWAQEQSPPPRFVFVSTSAVYAPTLREGPPVSESWPLAPRNGYGKSKLLAEQAVVAAAREGGLPAVIARSFQHTGPGQSTRMIVPDWAIQFADATNDPIRVLSLDTFLDLTDARDIVRAYRELALYGSPGEAYNVGGGVGRSGREIFAMLQAAAGELRQIEEKDPGAHWRPIADIAKLSRISRWRPEIPLETTIADTLAFWKEAPRP